MSGKLRRCRTLDCGGRSGAGTSATHCPGTGCAIHREFIQRRAFARWPVHGNVLEAFREGRLEIGEGTLFEPTSGSPRPGRAHTDRGGDVPEHRRDGGGGELVEIGDHCMFANGCFVTDANHRFDDPDKPITWQGFTSKGPTRVGDNVWCGANVVVTSGVTMGERSVIGANSVVTQDIPPYSIAAGAPAKVLRQVEYGVSRGRLGGTACCVVAVRSGRADVHTVHVRAQ